MQDVFQHQLYLDVFIRKKKKNDLFEILEPKVLAVLFKKEKKK